MVQGQPEKAQLREIGQKSLEIFGAHKENGDINIQYIAIQNMLYLRLTGGGVK